MKQFHNTLVRHSLLAALCAAAAAYAALQADLRSGFLIGFPDTVRKKQDPVQPAVDLGGTLYGNFALGKDLNLSFEDRLSSLTGLGEKEDDSPVDAVTGASKKLPVSEQNVPSENYGGIDLSYQGLRLGYRNLLYGRTRGLDMNSSYYFPDYFGVIDTVSYTYNFQYKRKMRQRYEGQYRFDNERFIADAALYHIITNGAIDSMLNGTDFYNSQPLTSTATRLDLMGGVRIPSARMKFIGGGRALLDHSAPSRFNSTDLYAMVEGNAAIDYHRLEYYLRTDYFSQGYLNDTLAGSHAYTGFFQTLYLRSNIWLGQAFMLKGLSVITFTENLIKQRFEVSLRKAWYEESSIEAGASTTMGGLFPMVGYFIRSTMRPIDPLALSLRLTSLWDWPRKDEGKEAKTLFVKAIGGGEVSYRLGSATEFYIGGDYTYFNTRTASNFPTRLFTGGGVRLYLP